MVRLRIALLLFATILGSVARADSAQLFVGGWKYDVNGSLESGGSSLGLGSGLNLHSQGQLNLVAGYQTDAEWLPDFSASYDHIGASSAVTVPSGFSFGPITSDGHPSDIATHVHFDDYSFSVEAPFYFFGMRTGFGITVKKLIGAADIVAQASQQVLGLPLPGTQATQTTREDINQWVPLLHLRLHADLTRWLGFTLTGNYIAVDDEHVGDVRAVLEVKPIRYVGLVAGYQGKFYKVNDDDLHLNARFDGIVFGVAGEF